MGIHPIKERNNKYDPILICKKYLEQSKPDKYNSNINIVDVK